MIIEIALGILIAALIIKFKHRVVTILVVLAYFLWWFGVGALCLGVFSWLLDATDPSIALSALAGGVCLVGYKLVSVYIQTKRDLEVLSSGF